MYMIIFIFRDREKTFIEERCQMCMAAHRACTAASALHSRTAAPVTPHTISITSAAPRVHQHPLARAQELGRGTEADAGLACRAEVLSQQI